MKKIYLALVALLSGLLVLSGCGGTTLLNYLKGNQFSGSGTVVSGNKYQASLTVNADFSYSLSVSYVTDGLTNYNAEGTEMEYLGCYEKPYTYEVLGNTIESTSYYHVVKLPQATVESNGNVYTFHIIGLSTAKNTDSYTLSLAYCGEWKSDADTSTNLKSIIDRSMFSIKR